ncbi:MAG: ABC transporter ATP-binding protein [Opitutus sp.]|nr:ABC transporter ATP-binding protein [Opitutus sp.]
MNSTVSQELPPRSPGRSEYEYIIEAAGLTKHYGQQRALTDVTVQVPPGTIGLLGPNGAGKSTFIKCLLNLTPATSGSARVLGRDIRARHRASRERVGYSPELDCHIPGMAGCEYVTYCGQLSGMSFRQARQRAHEILDLVGMGQERYRSIDTYSTGMKQRAKLAQALVHDPDVIFLDESDQRPRSLRARAYPAAHRFPVARTGGQCRNLVASAARHRTNLRSRDDHRPWPVARTRHH